jgi:hypothetical protein
MRGILIWKTAYALKLRPTALTPSREIAGSQQRLALQRVYVIDDGHRFVANKHHPFDIAVTQRRPILLTQLKLTCVNIEALPGAPQFPSWG